MDSRDPAPTPWPPRTRTQGVTDALAEVRRRLLRRRRLIAVLLVGVAVAASLRTLAPPPPASTTMLVAARDLPAGRVLRAEDLVARRVAPDVVPAGVVGDPDGRLLAAPLRAGEAVTDVRLVGAGLANAQPPGTVAVPVRLSDAGQAALLTVGDRIDLVASDPRAGTTEEVAPDVLVLAVPDPEISSDGALPGRLVVAALATADVHAVTAASVASYVTYTWRRR